MKRLSFPKPKVVVFDLGNVCIGWNRRLGYLEQFKGHPQRADYFFDHVCNMVWIDQMDRGATYAEAAPPLIAKHPDFRDEILAWPQEWFKMFTGEITETIQIARELKALGQTRLWILSNWAPDTFPWAEKTYPFINDLFEGKVISGFEGIRKPEPDIFHLLFDRAHIAPQEAYFIDDRPENIAAAAFLGMRGHVFENPVRLRQQLQLMGLLTPKAP